VELPAFADKSSPNGAAASMIDTSVRTCRVGELAFTWRTRIIDYNRIYSGRDSPASMFFGKHFN
jgi:hypothetical protein